MFSREARLLKPTADCQKQDSFVFNEGIVAARILIMKGGGFRWCRKGFGGGHPEILKVYNIKLLLLQESNSVPKL